MNVKFIIPFELRYLSTKFIQPESLKALMAIFPYLDVTALKSMTIFMLK